MHDQGVDVQSLNITGLQMLSQNVSVLDAAPAPPASAAAPAGDGPDLATIGKGIGERMVS
jgi:hypothetical protein